MKSEIPLSRRQAFGLASLLTAGFSLAACSSKNSSEEKLETEKVLRFANAAPLTSLDVAVSGTLETARISAQILEPLVRANINTGEPEACLATEWSISSDSLTYTFTLREGISFHDGSELNASAVLTNIERWKQAASNSSSNSHIAYLQLFGTFQSADGATALVTSYREEENRVIFTLSRPSTSFLKTLTQPAFGIASPAALNGTKIFTSLPVGTGPFRADKQEGNTVELTAIDSYWGSRAQIDKLIFSTISTPAQRYYALMHGDIDAYDLVAASNYVDLARAGNLIQPRDPYAITYLHINPQHEVFKDIRVRQAIAHALDRNELVRNFYPQGSKVADDFLPSLFMMQEDSASSYYSYNLEKAQKLLKDAGYKDQEIEFYYPTDVSLAALPQPEALYAHCAANLVEAGFNIVPKPLPWSEGYLDTITSSSTSRGLALAGFIGSYRDPNAFYSHVLASTEELVESSAESTAPALETEQATSSASASPSATAGAEEKETTLTYQDILTKIREADQVEDTETRRQSYKDISKMVAQLMPAVPIAYPVSSVALGKELIYYPLSATGICDFSQAIPR